MAFDSINKHKERIIKLKSGKWFLCGFIPFQYNCPIEKLNPKNKVHSSIINILSNEGIIKGLASPLQGVKDKDKDKDKEKLLKDNNDTNELQVIFDFDLVWCKYPKRIGRKQAERHFNASVKNNGDFLDMEKALNNYLSSRRVMNGYIQNGSVWFNNWRDWIEFQENVCPKCKDKGSFTSTTGYEIICDCPAGKRKR
jgi:hypothetical protein